MSDITSLIEPDKPEEPVKAKEEEFTIDIEREKGLISPEFFNFNVKAASDYNRLRSLGEASRVNYIKHRDSEFVPLYGINFSLDSTFPSHSVISNEFEISPYERSLNSAAVWQDNKLYVNFIKKCLENRHFNLLLFLKHNSDSLIRDKSLLRRTLKSRFDQYINSPIDLKILKEGRANARNHEDIMANVRYFCGWSRSKTKSSDPLAPSIYFLTNFYYMAKYSEQGDTSWLEPMFSVVVKRENISYIRACVLTNTPIPVEMLELWADKKLDDTTPNYKIRPLYTKYIKQPFKTADIKIVIHDNLFDAMYMKPALPEFPSLIDRSKWLKELSENFINDERGDLGIPALRKQKPAPIAEPNEPSTFVKTFGLADLVRP